MAEENARRAGVADYIRFSVADACRVDWRERGGVVICNPPYGVRMMEQDQAQRLARAFGKATGWNRELKLYIISSDPDFEQSFGRAADKKRKLYNGMLKCNLFQYFQPKQPGGFERPAPAREDRKPRDFGKPGEYRKPREEGKSRDFGRSGEYRKPRENRNSGEFRKPMKKRDET
jgi:putative N6-adenine-specific DNA methylase